LMLICGEDPRIGMACDYGESFFEAYPDSPAASALKSVVTRLGEEMGLKAGEIIPEE